MVKTLHGGGISSSSGSCEGSSDSELCELIVAEVSRAILEEKPGMFLKSKEGLIELMDKCVRTL